MNTLIWIGLGVALVIALIVEDSREWLLEQLETGWEATGEVFSGAFEDLSDVSIYGIVFGIVSVATIYLTRNMMLNKMLEPMTASGRIIWAILTYIACFAAGYFVGKGFENS